MKGLIRPDGHQDYEKKAADEVKEHPEGKKGKLNQCLSRPNREAPQLSWRTFLLMCF